MMSEAKDTAVALKGVATEEAKDVLKTSEVTADELFSKASAEAAHILRDAAIAAAKLERENVIKAEALVDVAKDAAKLLEESITRAMTPFMAAVEKNQEAMAEMSASAEESKAESTKVSKMVADVINLLKGKLVP